MDYEKKYKDALGMAEEIIRYYKEHNRGDETSIEDLEQIFPELKESEDEKIRKALIRFHKSTIDVDGIRGDDILAWLEKQGYTKKNVDDAYLKGIIDAKNELEKQGTPAKLSEEEQNSFAKGVLSSCALSFINYLDAHSYEGKMCVSNGECEDIENAFHNAMWDRLHRYYCKYIEKQGEQKPTVVDFNAKDWYVSKVDGKIHDMTYNPADKVEPKFKVGDWINGYYTNYKVTAISNKGYVVEDTDGNKMNILFENEKFHNLWTIQDAKDGDVLACGDKVTDCPFIFHNLTEELNPRSYCGVSMSQHFQDNDENGGFWCHSDEVRPATKEQRDLLFTKMKEAGYEWNVEKKELKKTEDEIEIPFGAKDSELQEETYYIPKGFHAEIDDDKVVIKKGEKPTAWSEKDENYLQSAENACEYQYGKNTSTILWLKSLKDRVKGKED